MDPREFLISLETVLDDRLADLLNEDIAPEDFTGTVINDLVLDGTLEGSENV